MRNNRIVLCITIIALILIIAFPTMTKIKDRNLTRTNKVLENKLKTTAISCWNQNICKSDIVYLKELKDYHFIKNIVNPLTDKNLSDESFVQKEKNEYKVSISY